MKKTPIEVFSEWAKDGRDMGMEKGHNEAVENMIEHVINHHNDFSFIDAGCGNGWVVRKVALLAQCKVASGVDGSSEMIKKARTTDSLNEYRCENLLKWRPENKVDVVHSMEVFYYVENPDELIVQVYSNWLNDGGRLIIGLDYYYENKVSHSWSDDCGITTMKLFPEQKWVEFFIKAGFKDVQSWRVGVKKDWVGTLVVTGIK